MDYLGARGWCQTCQYGVKRGESVYCNNTDSEFYAMNVDCLACSPFHSSWKNNRSKLHSFEEGAEHNHDRR